MTDSSDDKTNLSPQLRERLLKESQNPLLGLRRGLWLALFGSASIGLFIMSTRIFSMNTVPIMDLAIQLGAFITFGLLLYFDRPKETTD